MMKIRTDFVTNSSSSSYLIARKEELTQEQRDSIVDYITRIFLCGQEKVMTYEFLEKAQNEGYYDSLWKNNDAKIKEAISEGKSVYAGMVSFEDDMPEYTIRKMYHDIWDIVSQDGSLTVIDGDLYY